MISNFFKIRKCYYWLLKIKPYKELYNIGTKDSEAYERWDLRSLTDLNEKTFG